MTTRVTVHTVDWPVEVTLFDELENEDFNETHHVVEPNTDMDFAIWDTRFLQVVELKRVEDVG